ncbi:MAG: hypothetical protein LBE09_08530 [Christensenellaceae bacterium]|jgi:hypothetical protein|nr:hypothetical protein [Christensenellaceae bacterium]
MRKSKKDVGYDLSTAVRSSQAERQPQTGPFPAVQQSGNTPYKIPVSGNFDVSTNGMPFGLPRYTSVDDYGRIYTPIMTFGPQPNSAPVPIPIPSQIVQLTPIVSPVAFVPYSTQNQGLYQFDEPEER